MVITFLPFADFKKSAHVLDYKRLGKQRVEAHQILQAIAPSYNKKGWIHHPAVLMWKGYDDALKYYFNCVVQEWIDRGYKNNYQLYDIDITNIKYPWFIGFEPFHLSHQARLIQKNTEFYKDLFPDIKPIYLEYGYLWPSDMSDNMIQKITNNKFDNDLGYLLLSEAK